MRLPKILLNALLALCLLLPAAAALGADEDPYLWLEQVDGEKALRMALVHAGGPSWSTGPFHR